MELIEAFWIALAPAAAFLLGLSRSSEPNEEDNAKTLLGAEPW